MNKMHSLARIVLVGFGLYLAYQLISGLLYTTLALISHTLYGSQIIFTLSALLVNLCFALAIYQLICKREKWAAKIVGASDTTENHEQVNWLYFSLRLVSVAGGLFCLCRLVMMVGFVVQRYLSGRASHTAYLQHVLVYLLGMLLLLAMAIYLLFGAPHFVCWQVKKTLAQCKKASEVD